MAQSVAPMVSACGRAPPIKKELKKMADGPLATVRHRSSILAVTLATAGLLYHLSR